MGKKSQNNAAENIKVLVRCRPLNEKERVQGYKTCVDLDLSEHTVTVTSLLNDTDRWTFDAVINNTFTQKDVFTQFIMPLVDSVLDGFNGTVFAYGQSGSGKTHTMTGKIGDEELQGLTPRCFRHIFQRINAMEQSSPNKVFTMYVSFVELYNGKAQDLLARQQVPLALKENKDKSFFVQGAHIPQVKCMEDIYRHMEEGTERRRVASTDLNADSSRSHSIFSLIINCTETSEDGDSRCVTSKLNLVDLAGSERQTKTGALGDTLKEGCNINLSLSALGTVIDTIVKGKGHVPFRSSPLTMLLKDSLGGSSRTVMFANIGPSEHNHSETISTLRFADRAKQIKNKPVVNMDTKDQKIADLTELIQELREKLKRYETEGTNSLEEEVEKLREKLGEMEVNLDNSVKTREADAVDFENVKARLNMDRQNANARKVELEEQIAQLQNDLQILESRVSDERLQRNEVFHLCSKYLSTEGGQGESKQITNVEELETVLQDRSHGKHSAELAELHTTVRKLKVEAKQMRKEHKVVVKEMEEKLQEMQTSLNQAESMLQSTKEELEAMKAVPEEDLENSTTKMKEMMELRSALESAQRQLEERGFMPSVDSKLEALRKSHEETVKAYLSQLQQAKKALSVPGTNDSLIVQQLREILAEDDKTYNIAVHHMTDMYSLTQEVKSAMRAVQVVPLAVISGNTATSQEAISKIEAVDSQEAGVHADLLTKLHATQEKLQGHRNQLLDKIASFPGTPIDLKEEVQKLVSENDELRRMNADMAARSESLQAVETDKQRHGALQAQIDAIRSEYAQREEELLAAVKVNEQSGDGEALLRLLKRNQANRDHGATTNAGSGSGGNEKSADFYQRELENLQSQLVKERARSEALMQSKSSIQEELKSLRAEVSDGERRYVELESKMREIVSSYERRLKDASESAEKVVELGARLKERAEQLDQMRTLLEKQKALIVKSNEKSEYFQQKLRETTADAQRTEKIYREKFQERDENFQRLLNLRLEEYSQIHQKDISQNEEKVRKCKKKIKKIEGETEKWKMEYDRKVCECEELRNVIEEQKVEQMRLLRRMEQTEEEAQVYEKKEQIQNVLERAKEEQRRKKDLFAMGEVANVRRGDY